MVSPDKTVKNKLELLELADKLNNVSEACKIMGFSRDTYYRLKKAYSESGIEALKKKYPCPAPEKQGS